jgi:hypothetical protein
MKRREKGPSSKISLLINIEMIHLHKNPKQVLFTKTYNEQNTCTYNSQKTKSHKYNSHLSNEIEPLTLK